MITSKKYLNRLLEMSGQKSKTKSLFSEINIEDINIPKNYIKDNLNEILWDKEGNLKEEIKIKLNKIVEEYKNHLKLDIEPEDIKIVGSMANYNWTNQSDIDVHLFYDLEKLGEDKDFIKEYLDAKEKTWKEKHDIKFKDYDVELYAQDKNDDFYSSGVYSLLNNKWESKPEKEKVEIDKESLKNKIIKLASLIEDLEIEKSNPVSKYNKAKKIKDKIKKMRQSGLEEGGEFSVENLAFKYLRNNGFIETLMNIMTKSYDESLSIKQ